MTNRECALWLMDEAVKADRRAAPRLAEYLRDAAAKAALAHADDLIAASKYVRQHLSREG